MFSPHKGDFCLNSRQKIYANHCNRSLFIIIEGVSFFVFVLERCINMQIPLLVMQSSMGKSYLYLYIAITNTNSCESHREIFRNYYPLDQKCRIHTSRPNQELVIWRKVASLSTWKKTIPKPHSPNVKKADLYELYVQPVWLVRAFSN